MRRSVAGILVALAMTFGASAHRLDEYLQATLIGLTRDGVDIEIDLTPGVAVLPTVMAAMDRNRDGRISPEEEHAYAGDVLRDVELQLDGKPAALRIVEIRFPSPEAMNEGMGTIRLKLRADQTGHDLRFENRHMRAISVYLVNCLTSDDKSLAVGKPERDEAQRSIRFGYSFAGATGGSVWPMWGAVSLAAVAIATGLVTRRRHSG